MPEPTDVDALMLNIPEIPSSKLWFETEENSHDSPAKKIQKPISLSGTNF